MAEPEYWSPLGTAVEPEEDRANPTWSDYGKLIAGVGVDQLQENFQAAGRYLSELTGDKDSEEYYRSCQELESL